MRNRTTYDYTECGLDNVTLHNVNVWTDDGGDEVVEIKNIVGLHRLIAHMIVTAESAMTGPELRFLRTEMGLTQAELGHRVHKEGQTIGRWERGEIEIDQNAETVIRLMAIEALDLKPDLSTEEVAKLCVPRARVTVFNINAEDPENYRPMDQAA